VGPTKNNPKAIPSSNNPNNFLVLHKVILAATPFLYPQSLAQLSYPQLHSQSATCRLSCTCIVKTGWFDAIVNHDGTMLKLACLSLFKEFVAIIKFQTCDKHLAPRTLPLS